MADKLKLRTAAQAFKKFGPYLSIKDLTGKEVTKLYYPVSLKTKIDEFSCIDENEIYGSYRQQNLTVKEKCGMEGCDSPENLELHHTNPLKNISKKLTAFDKSIIAGQRKAITLCREHYQILHGKKLV